MWRNRNGEEETAFWKHLVAIVLLVNKLYSQTHNKMVEGVKGRITSLFKTNTSKDYSKSQHVSTRCMEVERKHTKIIKKKKDYYKPVKVGIFYNYNYITYESNGDRNVTLSVKEYRDEIKPYLKNQIISKKSDLWKFN